MTLKEKFSLVLMQFWTSDWEGKCEQVADEFTIGFAEWHLNLSKSDDWEKFDYNTTEKLLEIYKREKGL